MDQSIPSHPPVFTQAPVKPEPVKKSYKWLVVAVIIFLLASSSVLAYKYSQLKQQVTQTPASPIPSPSPLSTSPFVCKDTSKDYVLCEGNIVETGSSAPGGGITYQKPNGEKINCPVVAPNLITQECKNLQQHRVFT